MQFEDHGGGRFTSFFTEGQSVKHTGKIFQED